MDKPPIVAMKKDGKVRLCSDAKYINEKMKADYDNPQGIEEILKTCKKVGIISIFDLNMSFWQLPLHEDSKKFTAFMYKGNCYEFNIIPFRLKCRTAAFYRVFGEPKK